MFNFLILIYVRVGSIHNSHYYFRLANCGEYLFQATSDEEMGAWVNAINQIAIEDEGAAGGAGRS